MGASSSGGRGNGVIKRLKEKYPPKRPEESIIKKLQKRYGISELEKPQMFDDDDNPFDFFVKDLASMKEDLVDMANDVADIFIENSSTAHTTTHTAHSTPSKKRTKKKTPKPIRNMRLPSAQKVTSEPETEPAVAPPQLETSSYRGGLAEEYMKLKKENELLKKELIKTVQKELSEDLRKVSSGGRPPAPLAPLPRMSFFNRAVKWFKSFFQ